MAVRLETKVKHFLADSSEDQLPRVGVAWEGVVLPAADLPVGSSVLYRDTGQIAWWNGRDWMPAMPTDAMELYLAAILDEVRQLRESISLVTT